MIIAHMYMHKEYTASDQENAMSSDQKASLLKFVLFVLIVGIGVFEFPTVINNVKRHQTNLQHGNNDQLQSYITQRNLLSKRYNEMSQHAAKMSCEVERLTKPVKKDTHVSVTGGWCEKTNQDIIRQRADHALTYAMSEFLKGKKVGSFGDGPGSYKYTMDKDNKVALYDAFDGGPYYGEGTNGSIKYIDLTGPQYGMMLYDWVVSLEVAEHIDKKYEAVYLDNIVRHAAEGVIISWAYPGQPGIQHINCQPFQYVQKVMDNLGFYYSRAESLKLRKSTNNIYYRINVSVFRRKATHPVDLNLL